MELSTIKSRWGDVRFLLIIENDQQLRAKSTIKIPTDEVVRGSSGCSS